VFLSIPTSIIAGLFVGPIQRLFESWAGQAARAKRAHRNSQQTRQFVEHPEKYIEYFVLAGIRLLVFFAFTVIGFLSIGLNLGIVVLSQAANTPLSKKDLHFFLVSALVGAVMSGVSNTVFCAQIVRCHVWWDRVRKMRKGE
jgi:hypothetical protein